ncbi:hypothetical protein [Spiroplasma endosymbiont of Labia minor]|uniref:hypothetical protein n=1 Tax=Spiroplasma endosymbiont of Labia minor TaxID=3066305 RepID=UPI0030D183B2
MKKIWLFFVFLILSICFIGILYDNLSFFEATELKVLNNYKIRVNVNLINKIDAPTEILSSNINSVTYQEVETALNSSVFNAVEKLSPIATKDDYSFRIYSDNIGKPYENLNLNNKEGTVFVRISASLSSQILVGASNYLEVILPPGKLEVISLAELNTINSPTSITCNNSAAVTYNEIQRALDQNIFIAIEKLTDKATTNDYEYFLAKNISGDSLNTIDLEAKVNSVYVKVISTSSSTIFKDESDYIKVILPMQKLNLKKIKLITNSFIEISAINIKSVTYDELKKQLINYVTQAIEKIGLNVSFGKDYDFILKTNNIKNTYDNINLYQQTGDVYIKIKANNASDILMGETSNIAVPLLGERVDISEINKINLDIQQNDFKDINKIEINELYNVLKKSVLKSIQQNASQATYIDFNFEINQSLMRSTSTSIDLTEKNQKIYLKVFSSLDSVIIKGQTKNFVINLPYYNQSIFDLMNLVWIILVAVVLFGSIFLVVCEVRKTK